MWLISVSGETFEMYFGNVQLKIIYGRLWDADICVWGPFVVCAAIAFWLISVTQAAVSRSLSADSLQRSNHRAPPAPVRSSRWLRWVMPYADRTGPCYVPAAEPQMPCKAPGWYWDHAHFAALLPRGLASCLIAVWSILTVTERHENLERIEETWIFNHTVRDN